MKKSWVIFFVGIAACLLLSSCGVPNPPNENDIAQSISEDIRTVIIDSPFDATNSDVYIMDVRSVSIEKRQTNEKEDIAYCTIELENDYYRFTKSIITYYNYYDKGGWILDNYSEYNPTICEIKNCPFSSEDVAGLISDYSIIDANEPVTDTSSGTIEFTFDVKDEYENVTSEGTIAVLLMFDDSSWAYDINTDNMDLNWNILGHWYSSIYGGIYLDINELTNNSISVEVIYEDTAKDALAGNKGSLIDVSDERYWHLATQSTDIWEKYTDQGEPYLQFRFYFGTWSDTWNIYILKDSALAQVRMYPNTELYRVASNPFIPDTSNLGSNSSTSNEDKKMWDNLISEYFDIMETNNQEQILNYMLEAGPYGDDIDIRGEHVKNYEIREVKHSTEFYASMYNELQREIEIAKSEVAEYKPDLNIVMADCAAVYVQAEFERQDLGSIDYKFWFINNGGNWEIFYVDEVL